MKSLSTFSKIARIGIGLIAITALLLAGCGGGSSSYSPPSTPPPPSSPQLISIAVSPNSPLIHLGTVQQFAATGTYSDGSSQDVTALASWSSSDAAVAAVSNNQANKGLASGIAIGTATITVSLNGIDGTAQLTVDPAALTTIVVLPEPNITPPPTGQIAIAATLQYVAAGLYTDNSVQDISTSVT